MIGTGLATVALGLLAYDLASDGAGRVLGTALAIKMVAYVCVAPVAHALVERLPRTQVLVGADLLRMAVALPFIGEVWQVYVLIFVLQASSATLTPTFQSAVPSRPAPVRPGPAQEQETAPFGVRLRRGAVLFVQTPRLRPILALNLTVACAGAFVIVQTVVVVRSIFDLPEQAVAWVLGANGLGSMVAAFALPHVLRRVSERPVMIGGAVALICATAFIPMVLAADNAAVGMAAIVGLWLMIGLGWSCVETPVGRIIRNSVDRSDLSAAFAAQFSLQHACWLLTYPLAGWLGAVSLPGAAALMAGIAAVSTVVAFASWPRAVRPGPVADAARGVTA